MKVVPAVIAEVKRIREIFLDHHGVPISQEFVDFANAIGNLCDAALALALAAAAVDVPVEAQAKEESCGFVTSAITETTSETPSIIAKPASNLDGLMSTPHRITKKKSDFNSPENWEKYLDSIVNAPEPNVIVNEDGTCRPIETQGKPDAQPVIGPNTHRGEDGSVSVLGTSTGVAEPAMKSVPKFGQVITNTSAAESNPTRTGFFVREINRTGRLNPGRCFEITDGEGNFWETSAAAVNVPVEAPNWWLIYFEDKSQTPEVFNDEQAALARFENLKESWACHLFVEAQGKPDAPKAGKDK